jgi:hypothetical protein
MSCAKHGTPAGASCGACSEINRLVQQNENLRQRQAELVDLIWEILRAGNANTAAVRRAIARNAPTWLADVRAAVAKIQADNGEGRKS